MHRVKVGIAWQKRHFRLILLFVIVIVAFRWALLWFRWFGWINGEQWQLHNTHKKDGSVLEDNEVFTCHHTVQKPQEWNQCSS